MPDVNDAESSHTQDHGNHQDRQLTVQSHVVRVEEAQGRGDRLAELEQGEGRGAFVRVDRSQERVDLGVEARVPESQTHAARHRQERRRWYQAHVGRVLREKYICFAVKYFIS